MDQTVNLAASRTPLTPSPSPRVRGEGSNFGFVVGGPGAEAARLDDYAALRLGELAGGSLLCDGGDDGDVVARLQRAMVFCCWYRGWRRCAPDPLLRSLSPSG